ncbi:MAG: Fic family protein [Algoriphagus sp.]|nr:Fic family protein [Algoriphagus sp.]
MSYNWELPDWPDFSYHQPVSENLHSGFLLKSGQIFGYLKGFPKENQTELILEVMVEEAIKTSEIEGEFISRQDVLSSIRKNLGIHENQPVLVKDHRAKGIARLMIAVRTSYAEPLKEIDLFAWHEMLMEGNRYVQAGKWRTDSSPMQVVSGPVGKETVHFEAPPSDLVPGEMNRFIDWFNITTPGQKDAINNPMTRAGIAHLYFESIHPFEDGNGRIGRALAEKVLHQGLGEPTLISLSNTIEKNKNAYYEGLKKAQRSNEITNWLNYFAGTVIQAQQAAERLIQFTLKKMKFFDAYRSRLNDRQIKAINRMLEEGPDGFGGGMSAKKYMAITNASKPTATRDLQELRDLGVFIPSGGGRSVSYGLGLDF